MGNSLGKLSAIKFLKKLDVIFKFKISFVYNFIPMPDVMLKKTYTALFEKMLNITNNVISNPVQKK